MGGSGMQAASRGIEVAECYRAVGRSGEAAEAISALKVAVAAALEERGA